MPTRVAVLSTLDTKPDETAFLIAALQDAGCETTVVDLSLQSGGVVWDGETKVAKMRDAAARATTELVDQLTEDLCGVVALGGGTGGEMALQVLRALPVALPKLLVTTLPFDPRAAVADNAIVLMPTLADIAGLNHTLRQSLTRAAAMMGAMATCRDVPRNASVGITALGVTQPCADALNGGLREHALESTVFHANGYGGAGFARFARDGAFQAVIDMTVHEITRYEIAGAYTDMPTRFSCANALPRVVLPGGLNFLGLGALETISDAYKARPHYRHSGFFTHVQVTEDEMDHVASVLAAALNEATEPTHVLLPMGGFSHQDIAGGLLDGPHLREIAANRLSAEARAYTVTRVAHHINAPETAQIAIKMLLPHLH